MANSFVRYTGDGNTTAFAIPFSYIDSAHLACTVNGVSTSFTLNAAGTVATISPAPVNTTSIEFRRATSQNARLTDYVSGAVLTETDLDTDSTQGFMLGQEAIDDAADKISIDSSDFQWNANSKRIKNVAAPTVDTDAVNRAFISTNIPNITTVSGIASDVTTVAGISANVTTVAGNNANVTTVAGAIANVNTVATNIADVTTVANDLNEAISEIETAANDLNEATSEIDTVAVNIANVNTVGTDIANVNTVAGISGNVTTVAGISANVTSVAGNSTNINAVAGNSTNINAVAADATDIGTVAGISSDVTAVAGNNTNITAVAGNSTNINAVNSNSANINTVAGANSNITTVAGNNTNITAVAGISSDVTAVAADATDIGAVAGKATEIGLLGTADAIADMAILGTADVVADLNTLGTADVVADMNTLGTADVVADMNTLGTADVVNDMNVLGTSANVTNMNTLAGISSNITTAAGNDANITTVAGVSANVTTVAGIASDVTAAATNNANITTVAGAITNVNNVGGSIANVNTVASNLSGVNSFGERYRVDTSYPASSNDAGDLAFNTSANTFGYYDGSNWQSITAGGITSVAGDATPQLGGDLDLNSNDITGTGNINITGGVTMSGNLTVNGTTTTINSTTMTVDDKNMVLASGAADSSAADGAGLTIDGASATLTYTHSGTKWNVNKDFDVTGNIIVSGTVDGRDLQTDGTKLDAIEASATADQTGAEIKSAYEGEADTNAFTDALLTKLNAIEASADVTDATNVDAAGAIMNSDLATKGQIVVGDGAGDPTILSVGTDGHYLKADSSAASGVAWASVPAGVGGANGVDFNDDVKARFGDSNDLEIYHDGNDSYIKDSAGTGDLLIQTNKLQIVKANALDTMATFTGDGAVELRYDDAIVFTTTTDGIAIPDDKKLEFGASQDLQIYHETSNNHSVIKENGAGHLKLQAENILLMNPDATETYIECVHNGSTQLYHDNVKKLETASGGITVTGSTTSSGNVQGDGIFHVVGGTEIGRLTSSGNNFYVKASVQDGSILFQGNDGGSTITALTLDIANAGAATFNNNVTAYSDERLKTNIKTIDNALDKVSQMRGVTFDRDGVANSGVIAQEFEKIAPELVKTADDEMGTKSVAYGNTIGYLIEAIKELKSEIKELKGGK